MELSDSLLRLSELFPEVPLAHVSHILGISDGDSDAAVEQLLNYDLIKDSLHSVIENGGSLVCGRAETGPAMGELENRKAERKRELEGSGKPGRDVGGSQSSRSYSGVDTGSCKNPIRETLETAKSLELIEKIEKQDEMLELLEIGEANRDLVAWYLEQNAADKLKTVYDIMLNFNERLPIEEQPRRNPSTVSLKNMISKNSKTGSESAVTMSSAIRRRLHTMSVTESGRRWLELETLIENNPRLDLPKRFYLLAYGWFDEDVDKVLHLAIQLSDCFKAKPGNPGSILSTRQKEQLDVSSLGFTLETGNSGSDTCGLSKGMDGKDEGGFISHNKNAPAGKGTKADSGKMLEDLNLRARNLKNLSGSTNNKMLRSHYHGLISETKQSIHELHRSAQLDEVDRRIQDARRTFQIDFHDLTVQTAMYALGEIVDYWWDLEMHSRNVENTKFSITTTCHVDPLLIITGRGLHSGGGIPKIKNATVRFLEDHGFKYQDHTSSIEVIGKRR